MIKPDAFLNAGKIVNAIVRSNLRINQLRMCKLTQQEAAQFYAVHSERPFYPKLVDFMSSGPILAIEIVGEDAIAKWRSLLGPTNSETARAERRTASGPSLNRQHHERRPAAALTRRLRPSSTSSSAAAGSASAPTRRYPVHHQAQRWLRDTRDWPSTRSFRTST